MHGVGRLQMHQPMFTLVYNALPHREQQTLVRYAEHIRSMVDSLWRVQAASLRSQDALANVTKFNAATMHHIEHGFTGGTLGTAVRHIQWMVNPNKLRREQHNGVQCTARTATMWRLS